MRDLDNSSSGEEQEANPPPSIAIIGMAARFPMSPDLDSFWANLVAGRDCMTRLTMDEAVAVGLDPRALHHPGYIRAKGVLENALCFDAGLFGFSPSEAEVIDPQQRQFLEVAMAALEDAGVDPERVSGTVGIFGGQSSSTYVHALRMDPRNADLSDDYIVMGNDNDFLTTRASYKLNLKGPSLTVQSACSTSLVAVTLAYQSLLDYGCDVALAGGVSITFPEHQGYVFEEGSRFSPDGYMRSFDSRPSGLIGGNGVGLVAMKRLEDAIADRDPIRAVIRGAAVNNDGSVKIGYTAPSVDGQAEAISTALALGDIDPASIGYVEAHGTATRLGDPIEVAALTKAFRRRTGKVGYCGIGSVKSNIGHTDAAAGVAGLIKTVLTLEHGKIPRTLHVETTNPQIDFATSPFYVAKETTDWTRGDEPRRATVSSFGIGGTNAHAVLEEAPARDPSEAPSRDLAVLTLSANTASALQRTASRFAAALRADPTIDVHDAAFTLQAGRKAWRHRMAIVCSGALEAAELIETGTPPRVTRGHAPATASAPVAFLFPGQGAQYVGMMRGLYHGEPVFRSVVDECAAILKPELGSDIRDLIFAPDGDAAASAEIDRTRSTQPALFTVEYALARLWMSWGVTPAGMLGHSLGEYVAACLADVMDLADALRLIARRGALMQSLPGGSMASVPLPENEVEPLLPPGLSIASVLGPRLCVVSGGAGPLALFEEGLKSYGVAIKPLRTSHAFHSADMDPILERFGEAFQGVVLRKPKIPFVSNLSGTWITAAQATDPQYWVQQLRGAVRLWEGLAELTAPTGTVCLEVGPGRSLASLAQGAVDGRRVDVAASCRSGADPVADGVALMGAAGRLWTVGVTLDWQALSGDASRNKLHLPTYPYERDVFSRIHAGPSEEEARARNLKPSAHLLYAPAWRRNPVKPAAPDAETRDWLVFLDAVGFGARCVALLTAAGHRVTTVGITGTEGAADHSVVPGDIDEMAGLFRTLEEGGRSPDRVLHLWGLGEPDPSADLRARIALMRSRGFDTLIALARALGARHVAKPCLITVGSTGLHDVLDDAVLPEKALLLGPVRVIPVEYAGVSCRSVDLSPQDIAADPDRDARMLIAEAGRISITDTALRNGMPWTRVYDSVFFDPHGEGPPEMPSRFRNGGVYFITGGLGGIGLAIARRLAARVAARFVLVGRSVPADGGAAIRDEIAALGGEALVLSADVTNRASLAAALEAGEAHFGPLNGVVHAAGVAVSGTIHTKTPADMDRVMAPKIEGTLVLDEALGDRALDFVVACSSVSAVVGTPGLVEYTAANAFQDSYANAHRAGRAPHLSIEWDAWADVGMAVRERAAQLGVTELPPGEIRGLVAGQGAECFEMVLDANLPQVAVVVENFEWISRYGPPRAQRPPAAQAADESRRTSYDRPEIDTTFAAPTDPTEIGIAALFQSVLGIKEVGIDDNFFDLGGHSLLGVKLVNKIQETLGVEIGIGELFTLPTVRSLARTATTRRGGEAQHDKPPATTAPTT